MSPGTNLLLGCPECKVPYNSTHKLGCKLDIHVKRAECHNCRAIEGDRHAWGCPYGSNSRVILKLVKPEPEGLEEEHF